MLFANESKVEEKVYLGLQRTIKEQTELSKGK